MTSKERKHNKIILPELLAPAGNKQAFIAAVEAGADAVYCGTKNHNARMSAGNFSNEELQEAVDFAHKRGVKVHVTMNTLLKDEELNDALKEAALLWEMGVDALIVQDLGLAGLLKKYLPDFELHLSTQGTVYDVEGVRVAAGLGFSRVVLARELSLLEIKKITETVKAESIVVSGTNRLVEIEVFCHGALCYCYSGQCQMSRAIGGRSGNRGACAQPCRMRYESYGADGTKLEMPYPLSPSDMDLIEYLPEIARSGIASIKIEGRMKSPEYVYTVVSVYRKYLDILKVNMGVKVNSGERASGGADFLIEPGDKESLAQIFNRGFTLGNFLKGIRSGESGSLDYGELMSGETSKNKGLFLGTVRNCRPVKNKKSKSVEGRHIIDVVNLALDIDDIQEGDIIEVRGKGGKGEPQSAMVSYLEKQDEEYGDSCIKGSFISIGDLKAPVLPGSSVYRLSSSKQIKQVFSSLQNLDWKTGKYTRKQAIDGNVVSDGAGLIRLTVTGPNQTKVAVEVNPVEEENKQVDNNRGDNKRGETGVNPAENKMFDSEQSYESRFENSLRKTGGTPFEFRTIKFHGPMNYPVATSKINEMRRRALGALEEALCLRRDKVSLPDIVSPLEEDFAPKAVSVLREKAFAADGIFGNSEMSESNGGVLELFFYSYEDYLSYGAYIEKSLDTGETFINVLQRLCKDCGAEPVVLIPAADAVKRELPHCCALYINNVAKGKEIEILKTHLARFQGQRIYVGNLSQLAFINEANKNLEKPICIMADFGLNIYNSHSLRVVEGLGARKAIQSLESDEVHYGAYPLMTIGYDVYVDRITDRKGVDYRIVAPQYSDQRFLIKETALPDCDELSRIARQAGENCLKKRLYIKSFEA